MGDLREVSFKPKVNKEMVEDLEALLKVAKAGRLRCVLATWYEDPIGDGEFAPGGEIIWGRNSSILELLGESFRFTMQLYEESVDRPDEGDDE